MNPDYTIYTSYRYDVVPTIVGPIVPILIADFRTDRIFLKNTSIFTGHTKLIATLFLKSVIQLNNNFILLK